MMAASEPDLVTDTNLMGVTREFVRREPSFHHSEFGTTRADFECMVTSDFSEIGASGRKYSRDDVLDELEKRHSSPHEDKWQARDFYCRQLAPNNYLLNSALVQDDVRVTHRTTIWRSTPDGWKVAFHQGTLVEFG